MRSLYRNCAALAGAAALLLGVAALTGWVTGFDFGRDNSPAPDKRSHPDGAPLPQAVQVTLLRDKQKRRITQMVLARRMTLMQAATEFRHIDLRTSDGPIRDPEALSTENLCRSVVSWVRAELAEQGRDDPILAELEAECARRFADRPPNGPRADQHPGE